MGISQHALLVEDNDVNAMLLTAILEDHHNFTVITANNGLEAVKLFENSKFDIIFMDCDMPLMNGYEATIAIREIESRDSNFRYTPIIATTAHAMKGDNEKCLNAGMSDYVSKPISLKGIHDMLDFWLPLDEHPLKHYNS